MEMDLHFSTYSGLAAAVSVRSCMDFSLRICRANFGHIRKGIRKGHDHTTEVSHVGKDYPMVEAGTRGLGLG